MKPIKGGQTEVEVMKYITYCEKNGLLNSNCGLSTIESLRRQSPEEVRKALRHLKGNT